MRHPSIRAVYGYWATLRAERPAPLRTEIDPRALARELGDVFLLEGTAEAMTFRLAGSRIVHALGDSLTGKGFASLWHGPSLGGANEALATVNLGEQPMLLGIRRSPADKPGEAPGRPAWANLRPVPGARPEAPVHLEDAGELLLLPLRTPVSAGRRIMGSMAFFSPPALPASEPCRLTLTGGRVLGREAQPIRGADLRPGLPFDRVGEQRGHLFVMQGNRDRQNPP